MPLTRFVVGVDFSAESDHAVAQTMMLARQTGATVTLVHAAPTGRAGASTRLTALRDRLAGQGVDVSQVVVDGEPDPAVADAARELDADLLAVGTHGRSGVRRLVLGSVAEKTARLAAQSVLIARGDAPVAGFQRVVVGTDFSQIAWTALERAIEVTTAGGHVQVVHSWRPEYVDGDLTGSTTVAARDAAEDAVERNRARVMAMPRRADITIGLVLAEGPPFDVLDAYSNGAQLVVVGSHGRRGIRRLLLGSVAEATIRHARCSVLVAR